MAAPSKSFSAPTDAEIDPDSAITTSLHTKYRDNDVHLEEWLGDSFTAAKDHDHDGVNSKVVSGADFILVEKKLVTSDVTTVTFGSLDGDTDEVYKIVARIISSGGGGAVNYFLRPNGVTTNLGSIGFRVEGTTIAHFLDSSEMRIAERPTSASVAEIQFETLFHAKRNPNGVATRRAVLSNYNAFAAFMGQTGGGWDETASNVTSIDIVASVATEIEDGSTILLYKLRQ